VLNLLFSLCLGGCHTAGADGRSHGGDQEDGQQLQIQVEMWPASGSPSITTSDTSEIWQKAVGPGKSQLQAQIQMLYYQRQQIQVDIGQQPQVQVEIWSKADCPGRTWPEASVLGRKMANICRST